MFVNTSTSYKSNQFLWLVFKLLIVISCTYFIYDILTNNENLKSSDFQSILTDFNVFSIKNIAFLLIFSIFNWWFEIKKWQVLTQNLRAISWFQATEQSLASLTFSLITPNRIGEYGAKAVYFKKEDQKSVLLLNFIGNFYQLFFTLLFGWIGYLYVKEISKDLISPWIYWGSLFGFILFIAFLAFVQLHPKIKKRKQQFLQRFKLISKSSNKKVLLFSLIRYLLFSHQFYFLTTLFPFEISYWQTMAAIASMYFLASIIPMLSLFDFVVKGSVAVLIFGLFEVAPIFVLSVTTLMWICNFALPALLGSYFVLSFKPVKNQ